jgi:hypothetical protein
MDVQSSYLKVKPILKVVLVLATLAYVLWSPNSASETLRVAIKTAVGGVLTLGDSAAKFFDALLRH